ncbi:hypothetical protein [Flavobacterium phragmitis]|uniref:Uncharacterized protein n=1 Tax=Flavobacterium phragmitis TaxID=739143 RepID=A0A1I1RRX0_9FLAO|nr:hypothetical protein [Flavobacterium phragmitis]SFD37109.1 hypothetical protein SAMN05216297_107131 [Flavobacterium phragmitis]
MNTESIKILRSKIAIPLSEAIRLLKKNNDDVILSEQDFHNENIIEICKKADCQEETARKEYHICDCDVIKTIERINQKLVVIATGNNPVSKIGFILWPENAEGEFYKTEKRNDVFIQTEDFDLVLKEFQNVFPMKNPWNNEAENEFDVLGHNYFDNKTCEKIVEEINKIQTRDKKEETFLAELKNWLNDKLNYADFIVVYGNL